MASLDVESLFTNIPVEETINVCGDSLCSNDAKVNRINIIDFKSLLRPFVELPNNFFNLERKIYKQIDGSCYGISTRSYFGKCIFMFP